MKYFVLLFIVAAFFAGCKSSGNRVEDLTQEQKQQLDKKIPPEVREILDKADEITVSYNIDKDTMQLKVLLYETSPNANANVSDPAAKKRFLESFYSDAASNSNGASCFSPRHRLSAKYQSKVVEIDICYECSRFRGKSPSGDFVGGFEGQGESSSIMDAIIEKYGAKVK
jgi:hypothetical protein